MCRLNLIVIVPRPHQKKPARFVVARLPTILLKPDFDINYIILWTDTLGSRIRVVE
jgi:hypothetical protein